MIGDGSQLGECAVPEDNTGAAVAEQARPQLDLGLQIERNLEKAHNTGAAAAEQARPQLELGLHMERNLEKAKRSLIILMILRC